MVQHFHMVFWDIIHVRAYKKEVNVIYRIYLVDARLGVALLNE